MRRAARAALTKLLIGMMMATKNPLTALAAKLKTAFSGKSESGTQAGARAAQNHALNYSSVNTLDPSRLAAAFAQADTGWIADQAALFELVEEQDPHIYAELGKRRRSVTGLGWQLQPEEDADQSELDRCTELADMLRDIPRFEDAQYDLTDAIGKGFAALEMEWQFGEAWLPKMLNWVPQRMFKIDRTSGELMLLKNGIPEPLREHGWLVHEHRAKSGYIEQAALFRVLAWTYAYKAYNMRDMQRFLEVYGMPLRLGKFPTGIAKEQRDELLKAVRNLGSDGAGVVPNTMQIEFVQATNKGNVTDFMSAIEYWEKKQSMAILGGTLTSQADGKTSTNALGVIHDKARREIMLHDVRQIEPTLTSQLVRPIALFNGMFTEDRLPKFTYDTAESVDQRLMADVLARAADMGMEIDIDWAHKALQIPRAEGKVEILKTSKGATSPESAAGNAALTRMVSLAKAKAAGDVKSDVLPAYIAQLSALSAPHEQALVEQIAALVAEAGDYDSAIEAIEKLAMNASSTDLAEALALGLAAANLAGRGEL
jgi:phage gp29-like protein